ncbi:MAG: nitrile hydratase subunit alpha [Kiloniellales bacterium]|nr:nitrile hydratase subunit alpha [Kiloniellales bacterium]
MANDTHGHAHPGQPHPFQPDDPEPKSHHEVLGVALRELLIEKGLFTAEDERRQIETLQAASPATGARIVAHAWSDPDFKARLLATPNAAIEEMGIDCPHPMIVVENSADLHNVIVCTLCSCYPRMLLGPQPAWYKSANYRARVVREPRAVLREFGTELADDVTLKVHDSTAEMRYLVLPRRPAGTEGWSEAQLAELVTRDSLIGVCHANQP